MTVSIGKNQNVEEVEEQVQLVSCMNWRQSNLPRRLHKDQGSVATDRHEPIASPLASGDLKLYLETFNPSRVCKRGVARFNVGNGNAGWNLIPTFHANGCFGLLRHRIISLILL